MSQKTERKTSKKKGKKSKKKVSNYFVVLSDMFSTILSAQKVEVVVEVDLTSDKAKNDMIQVTSKHPCKLIPQKFWLGSAGQN